MSVQTILMLDPDAEHEEELGDLSASPYWNADLAPVAPSGRDWGAVHFTALWLGMGTALGTLMVTSTLMADGMTWQQSLFTMLLGSGVVLVAVALLGHAGTKHGITFPVLCRAAFGTAGALVPATLRAAVACAWLGLQTWVGGLAVHALLLAAVPAWEAVPHGRFIAFGACWLVQVAVLLAGMNGVRTLLLGAAPLLLAGATALLVWAEAVAPGGIAGALLALQRSQPEGADSMEFLRLLPAGLGTAVGFWTLVALSMPDYTRFAATQRVHLIGQAVGVPLALVGSAFAGLAAVAAGLAVYGEPVRDPIILLVHIGSPVAAIAGACLVLLAQATTNVAASMVAAGNAFSSLAPRRIGFVAAAILAALLAPLVMPWHVYGGGASQVLTILAAFAGLLGAVAGILAADYWVVRGRVLDVRELYAPRGRYHYTGGWNVRALLALALAIAPALPGLVRALAAPAGVVARPGIFDHIHHAAWFVTSALGFVLHIVLARPEQ